MHRIHWRKLVTRKMVVIAVLIVAGHFLDAWWHFHLAGKGGEMLLGVTVEHFCFGIPLFEE
jgi:hypothetical protein